METNASSYAVFLWIFFPRYLLSFMSELCKTLPLPPPAPTHFPFQDSFFYINKLSFKVLNYCFETLQGDTRYRHDHGEHKCLQSLFVVPARTLILFFLISCIRLGVYWCLIFYRREKKTNDELSQGWNHLFTNCNRRRIPYSHYTDCCRHRSCAVSSIAPNRMG